MSLILDKYKNKRRLGGGAFGDVQLVVDQDGNQYALKMISKNIIAKEPYMEEYIQGEKECMMSLKSQYVVRLYNVEEDKKYKYFLCEYCDGGDLLGLQARQPNKVFSLKETINILSQVIMGLEHVHRNGYLHRDIKLQNILVKKNGNGPNVIISVNKTYKLADFGFSKRLENVNGTVLGTQNYMSPEIYLNQMYNYEIDMWAFGVLFYFMLNMQFPFNINIHTESSKKRQQLLKQAKNFSYEAKVRKSNKKIMENCIPEVQDLFKKMFDPNTQKRINFAQLRSHPLFKSHFPNPDKELAQIYQSHITINRYDSYMIGKRSGAIKDEKTIQRYILSDEEHIEVSPSCFLKKPKTTQENEIVQIDLQKIDFLKDAVQQISYNISFVEPSEILAFRYNVFKFYVVLLRDLSTSFNPEFYSEIYPKLRWATYFKSAEAQAMRQQIKQHMSEGEMKVSEAYDLCKSSFTAIKKINPSIEAILERQVSQKQFTPSLKASYRTSTSGLFTKLREKANNNNQFTYLTLLVLMIHGFNNIVKTNEEDLQEIFSEFKAKNKDSRIDFRILKGWLACLDKQRLKNLIVLVNNTYFGGK